MGRLLVAEIHYHLPLILIYHLLILLIGTYELVAGSDQSGIAILMIHLVVFFILQNRINEKLERMQVLLPISMIKIGLVRLFLLSLPVLSLITLYYGMHRLKVIPLTIDYLKMIFLAGIFLGIYLIFCFGRDLYFTFGSQRIIKFSTGCMLALSFGIAAMVSMFWVLAKLKFFDKINAILEEFLVVTLICLLIFLALLTIYSFSLRKSYL